MDRDQQRSETIALYLAGRLPETDRAAFESEINADEALTAEVAALRAARSAAMDDAAAAAPDDGEGWRRLSAKIDDLSATVPSAAPAPANDNRPSWMPKLAQAAAIALASVFLWEFVAAPSFREVEAPSYLPVSEVDVGIAMQVIFAETASAADIASLVRGAQGEIIGGPSALGVFRVAFETEIARDAAIAAFADHPAVASAAK